MLGIRCCDRFGASGYPPGYARVIHSPEQFQMTPMQIDSKALDTPQFIRNRHL